VVLQVASVIPGVVDLVRGTLPPAVGQPAWFAPAVASFTLFVVVAIALLILSGRNWARWLFAIMFVVGIPTMMAVIGQLSTWLHDRPARAVLLLMQSLVQVVALIFLYLPEANAWFRAVKAARKPA
jgi:hypothetical protein